MTVVVLYDNISNNLLMLPVLLVALQPVIYCIINYWKERKKFGKLLDNDDDYILFLLFTFAKSRVAMHPISNPAIK